MEVDKVRRIRTIERLIEEGRYDEAEEMLKNNIVPNTGKLQKRIDDLRAEARLKQEVLTAPAKRRMKYFVIALLVIFAVTGVVVFAVHSSVAEYVWFFIFVGFIFIIPRTYRSASRGDALERRLNRPGYRRPGFGPRR